MSRADVKETADSQKTDLPSVSRTTGLRTMFFFESVSSWFHDFLLKSRTWVLR